LIRVNTGVVVPAHHSTIRMDRWCHHDRLDRVDRALGRILAAGGLVLGLGFGFFGQRSKFCLRVAVIEFWHRRFGDKLAVWLLAFSTAVVAVQSAVLLG